MFSRIHPALLLAGGSILAIAALVGILVVPRCCPTGRAAPSR
jgi:hypothetical protein